MTFMFWELKHVFAMNEGFRWNFRSAWDLFGVNDNRGMATTLSQGSQILCM